MNKLILALLFTPFISFSQEESNKSKIIFGVFVLPEMNGLKTTNPIGTEKVTSKFGFSAGLNFEYRFAPKVSLRSGFGYGLKNYDHLHEGLIFNSDIDPQNGIQSESRMESSIRFSEVQLPILIQYKLTQNVFFTLGCEINAAFADQSERIIYYGNGETEQLENATGVTMNYATVLSIGFSLPDSNVFLEPVFKYYIQEHIIAESNHFNYGLKMTYNFNLWDR